MCLSGISLQIVKFQCVVECIIPLQIGFKRSIASRVDRGGFLKWEL